MKIHIQYVNMRTMHMNILLGLCFRLDIINVMLTSMKKPRTANAVLSLAARAADTFPLYFEWTLTMCSYET